MVERNETQVVVAAAASADLGAAFAALRGSLRAYLRKRVNDPAVVDDLLQDVFVKASAAFNTNRAPRNLTGWLYTAAHTTVIDHYRASRPQATELDEELLDTRQADDELLHQQLASCLRPLARQLPAIYRDTLLATDFDGKTMQSVAQAQHLSLSAIKSRASRARVMLKEKLLDCCAVETSGGAVVDYAPRPASGCGGGCRGVCG